MKVTFVSHLFPNLADIFYAPFMYERVKALSRLVNIKIIAPVSVHPFSKKSLPAQIEIFKSIQVYHPRYFTVPSAFWSIRWFFYLIMLERLPKDFFLSADILHVEWIYPDACAVVKLAQKIGIKTVGVVHGNEAIDYYGPRRGNQIYRRTLSSLDRIIVVSRDLQNKLVLDYGVSPERISVIFNGVDLSQFAPSDSFNSRAQLGLPTDIPIGICVARLSEEKNIDILIKAIAKFTHRTFRMYIVGDGSMKTQIQRLIDDCCVQESVLLVGPVPHDQIRLWLSAGNFFCLPSQREGCPVVIHEALACGRPVVATAVGAIPDLISGTEYGILCSPGDVDGLACALTQALVTKWDHEQIAAYGRQYTWKRMAAQTVKVYQEVLT